jgi:hypothetical protein
MTVTLGQLKDRAQTIEARMSHFEELLARQGGRLKTDANWRLEYAACPYLIGAPDDRLASRFKDVFINQTELNTESKLGFLPIEGDDGFMPKFTHLLEEYGLRGNDHPPDSVLAAARAPVLKYFENGGPIAKKIFRNYVAPTTPFTVKYGMREHLEPMLRTGRVRICQASYYNNASHNAAIQDDEIHRTFYIPTFREHLKGIHHIVVRGYRIEFGDDDIVLPVEAADYFLLSLCDSIYYRMPTDFGFDSALIIRDPSRFAQLVISSFLARYPDWKPHYGPVTYYDPYRDYKKVRVHQMSKHFGYAYQREIRIVMEPRRNPREPLQPEFLNVGSMEDYAQLLSA